MNRRYAYPAVIILPRRGTHFLTAHHRAMKTSQNKLIKLAESAGDRTQMPLTASRPDMPLGRSGMTYWSRK
jgi:hypothetical protein